MLRVISGKYRHRLLEQPPFEITRPTMDRVREAIMSSLRSNIQGKIVLELYAGSGAMSIETISNGAAKAVVVENSHEAVKIIRKNISTLGIENMDIFELNVQTFLTKYTGRVFDYIFVDPPYKNYDDLNQALELIKTNKFLDKYGYIIVETDNLDKIKIPQGMIINKAKKFGAVFLAFIANII